MSEGAARQWRLFVDDMIVCGERAVHYASKFDQAEFFRNPLYVDATLRNLELIGEAASRIPADVRNEHADVPWRLLIALRNRLIHSYLGIDNDTISSVCSMTICRPSSSSFARSRHPEAQKGPL